jgi:DNA-directed RNA polymerase specialized sigma24 family protein|tara:strand:- start:4485 stop:5066 length:582 start_codon:yes stop_codon:yes gene_type:complete
MMQLLSKYHNLWISMGLSMGIPKHLVEDFVQEMYLRLNKYVKNPDKIMYNETEVNKFYVYITIKNLYNDYLKENKRHQVVRLDDIEVTYEVVETTSDAQQKAEIEKQRAEEKLVNLIHKEVNSWDRWYDQKLFKVYYETDISMRKLSADTNISVTSIFNSCKNYKEILNTKLAEDFQDYINGDFHLIKINKDE